MEVMIHACPARMWYVEGWLIPVLERQGITREHIRIWNDTEGHGNLISCMEAFASCKGDGGTWHIQDDVLPRRGFARIAAEHDEGVVYGFCCQYFLDDPNLSGTVYMPDAWHSFQCVRIPNAWARECAEWFFSGAWESEAMDPDLPAMKELNHGDDSFFGEFLMCRHGEGTAYNLRPNIVEHVDLLIGGSVLHQWRDYQAKAHWWDDPASVEELRAWLKAQKTARAGKD